MASRKDLLDILKQKRLLESCFQKQSEPVLASMGGEHKRITILTSRRAGKTNGILIAMCIDAMRHPGKKYAYIGLSRTSAEDIVWKELDRLNDAFDLKIEMQGYRLRAIFPNGSYITLYGADQKDWIRKFKGNKYRMAAIDECGEFDSNTLRELVYKSIRPCLIDDRGVLFLIGTPGEVESDTNFWYQLTGPNQKTKGWKHFTWHSFDNPHISEAFKLELDDLVQSFGEDELYKQPWFRREYLGEWCTDTSNNVYQYKPDKNDIFSWSPAPGDRYMLGLDPGFSDAAAFVVACYNNAKSDKLIFIESESEPGLQPDEIADRVEMYMRKYPNLEIICDNDAAQLMSYMRERRGIPVIDARKQKKQHAIRLANNEFMSGRAQLLQPGCLSLGHELLNLQRTYAGNKEFKQDGVSMGEWKENQKQPNDQTDAALYLIRYALNFMYKPASQAIDYGTEEYYEKKTEKLRDQALRKIQPHKPHWKRQHEIL